MASSESIDENLKIDELDVRKCEASRPEDKAHILWKIERNTGVELFNEELHRIIGGIAYRWTQKENTRLKSELEKSRTREFRTEIENSELRSRLVLPPEDPQGSVSQ